MTKIYKIAHIHEQGQDIIIIPLEPYPFDSLSQDEKDSIGDGLQFFATDAGLKGVVCLVWQVGSTFKFIAPSGWHPFFRSINMDFVHANLNRVLTCTYEQTP